MDNLIGKTLGHYQIVQVAGKGGMAVVYKALQPSLNRYVALKVLPHYLAADQDIAVMAIGIMAIGVWRGRGGLPTALQTTTVTPTQVAALPTSALVPTAAFLPVPSTATLTPAPTSTPTSPAPLSTATLTQPTATPTQAATLTRSPTRPALTTPPSTLFGFETPVNWLRGDLPNGTLTQSTAQAHLGIASARLDYSFATSANDYVVFINQVPASGQPNAAGAWVYGNGSGHFLNVRIKDASGELWQVPLGRVGSPGWNQMVGYIHCRPGGEQVQAVCGTDRVACPRPGCEREHNPIHATRLF